MVARAVGGDTRRAGGWAGADLVGGKRVRVLGICGVNRETSTIMINSSRLLLGLINVQQCSNIIHYTITLIRSKLLNLKGPIL
jgi:hypothetical protein